MDDPLQRGTPAGSLRWFAVLYAPPAARPLLEALYAFEAEVRDTARASHDVAHTRLQWWRGEVDRLLGGRPEHPVTRALLPLRADGVDLALLHEVLVAADIDLARLTLDSADELAAYAYRGAGSLQTLAAAASCRPRAPSPAELEFARRLGAAVQGTEALRDLRTDVVAGRIRLPLDQLEQAGIEPARLLDEPMPPGLGALLERRRAELREELLAIGGTLDRGERADQRQGLVLAALHARLLERIDQRTAVAQTRAELPPWSRLWTAWRTALRHG